MTLDWHLIVNQGGSGDLRAVDIVWPPLVLEQKVIPSITASTGEVERKGLQQEDMMYLYIALLLPPTHKLKWRNNNDKWNNRTKSNMGGNSTR